MPPRFSLYTARVRRYKELRKTDFRNNKLSRNLESDKFLGIAPTINCCAAITGYFHSFHNRQQIIISCKLCLGVFFKEFLFKLRQIAQLISECISWFPIAWAFLIPMIRCTIFLRTYFSVNQIGYYIVGTDCVPARFLPVSLQGIDPFWRRWRAVALLMWAIRYNCSLEIVSG